MNNDTYWFARGYFDARKPGGSFDRTLVNLISDACWDAYDRGYECGISDYCAHDIAEAA